MRHPFPLFELVVPHHQKQRLAKTCFRGERKAGCFAHWMSVEDVFLDPEVGHLFNQEVEGVLAEPDQSRFWSFTINCKQAIGWSSTIPLSELAGIAIETRPLKSAAASFVADPRIRARLTQLITFIINIKRNHDEITVLVESMYPGEDVGPLRGNVTNKTGLAFFDWDTKGQSMPKTNPGPN